MIEHLWKAFELYLNRKDKFIKAEERLKRRLTFFEEVKKLENNNDLDEQEKRVIRNGLAQIVCGSRLVDYELVEYYYRHKKFRNFEVIVPIVAFWDESIVKEYDSSGKIELIKIEEKKYRAEKTNSISSLVFIFGIAIVFILFYQRVIDALVRVFHMDPYIALYVCGTLFLLINFLVLFAIYGVLTVFDLRRLIEDR
ncbi:hypothetical protein FPL18_16955 [Acinetobacter gyllenbergii]|nr:hypothetical protein FPL18_16955 [Acinetobacter gyllenbergii]